jgi:hypothetical protein
MSPQSWYSERVEIVRTDYPHPYAPEHNVYNHCKDFKQKKGSNE